MARLRSNVIAQAGTWAPLVIALGCALAYATFFVLPFYVNDMDRFPLEEVASGAHDPSGTWPYDTPIAFAFALGALATLGLGPLMAGGALLWAAVGLWLQRSTPGAGGKVRLGLAARGRCRDAGMADLIVRFRADAVVARLGSVARPARAQRGPSGP